MGFASNNSKSTIADESTVNPAASNNRRLPTPITNTTQLSIDMEVTPSVSLQSQSDYDDCDNELNTNKRSRNALPLKKTRLKGLAKERKKSNKHSGGKPY